MARVLKGSHTPRTSANKMNHRHC